MEVAVCCTGAVELDVAFATLRPFRLISLKPHENQWFSKLFKFYFICRPGDPMCSPGLFRGGGGGPARRLMAICGRTRCRLRHSAAVLLLFVFFRPRGSPFDVHMRSNSMSPSPLCGRFASFLLNLIKTDGFRRFWFCVLFATGCLLSARRLMYICGRTRCHPRHSAAVSPLFS